MGVIVFAIGKIALACAIILSIALAIVPKLHSNAHDYPHILVPDTSYRCSHCEIGTAGQI